MACLVAGSAAALALDRSGRTTEGESPPPLAYNYVHLIESMRAHARRTKGPIPTSIVTGLASRLKAGSKAPDFTLPEIVDRGEVSLSSHLGTPVVLIFGSFSCDAFCGRIGEVERLHRVYGDRADFLFVNVTEAGHEIASQESSIGSAVLDTPEGRRVRVVEAMRQRDVTLPGVRDVGASVEIAYDAFPNRLVVVGADGRIVLDFGRNLFRDRWDLDGLEAWLKARPGRPAQE